LVSTFLPRSTIDVKRTPTRAQAEEAVAREL
jgi:hypothetical protein